MKAYKLGAFTGAQPSENLTRLEKEREGGQTNFAGENDRPAGLLNDDQPTIKAPKVLETYEGRPFDGGHEFKATSW